MVGDCCRGGDPDVLGVIAVIADSWHWPLLGTCLLALIGGSGAVAWGSNRLRQVALLPGLVRPRPRGVVREFDGSRITLAQQRARRLRVQGTWGLEWPGGYARVRDGERSGDRQVTYLVDSVRGTLPIGTAVEMDARAYELEACGFETVSYPATSGRFDAWLSSGAGNAWMIGVHGQSGTASEMLRAAQVGQSAGLSTLLISYRNDGGQARTDDGFFHFGRSEWEELEGALAFAREHGARHVVLVANSMGAAIVGWWLRHSAQTELLRGIFLDAPLLDVTSSVQWTARRTHVPPGLARVAMGIQHLRHGIEWRAYDVRDDFAQATVPVLIVHGDRDGQVPLALSEALATRAPEHVRLVRVEGAGHGQAWNHDRDRYEQTIRYFLDDVLPHSDLN